MENLGYCHHLMAGRWGKNVKKLMREREHKSIKLKRREAQNVMRKMMKRLSTQKMKYSDVEEIIKGSENEKLEGDNVIEREDRLEDESTDDEKANDFLELHVEKLGDI